MFEGVPAHVRGAAALTALIVLGGCDSILSARAGFAEEARISISGQSAVPLRLITSSNYFQAFDVNTGNVITTTAAADTFVVSTLPYTRSHSIRGTDRYMVRLENPDSTVTATVHVEVSLDDRLVYTQHATLRNAALEYTTFFSAR